MIRKFYLCTAGFKFSSGLTLGGIAVSNERYDNDSYDYPPRLTLRRTTYVFNNVDLAMEDFKILRQRRL